MKRCTAIVINFLREPYLFECLRSLNATYPDMDIIVGENGYYTQEKRRKIEQFAKYYPIEFDAGVCKGRNFLVDKVKTEYVLVGDDDFSYNTKANLDKVLDFLDRHPEIDLVGGRVIEGEVLRNYQGFIDIKDHVIKYTALELDNFQEDGIKYKKCDITFNFFIARTEIVKKARWDENIKVAYEHSDFFLELKKIGANVVFTPDMLVIHKPKVDGEIPKEYLDFRKRKSDKKYFFRKHKISHGVDMQGRKDTIEREEIKKIDFLISTMDRRECLEKLLFSIVKYYPEANIYIGDNGRWDKEYYVNLWEKLIKTGLKHRPCAFNIGFDKGLSYTRNFLVHNTPNVYKLILDDDMVFNEDTDVLKMVDVLDDNPDVGVVGGALIQDGNIRHYEGFLEIKDQTLYYKKLDYENLKYTNDCDIVFNFAMFRSVLFGDCEWDNWFKITGEHSDFFLRLKQTKWKVLYIPSVIIGHEQFLPPKYKEFRARTEFFQEFFNKHNINKIINFNGVVFEKEEDAITKYRI